MDEVELSQRQVLVFILGGSPSPQKLDSLFPGFLRRRDEYTQAWAKWVADEIIRQCGGDTTKTMLEVADRVTGQRLVDDTIKKGMESRGRKRGVRPYLLLSNLRHASTVI